MKKSQNSKKQTKTLGIKLLVQSLNQNLNRNAQNLGIFVAAASRQKADKHEPDKKF